MKERTRRGKTVSIVGVFCNILLFVIKLVLGLWMGALSIVADAINNLSDAFSSVVTFVGFRLSEKPADADHPYGHGRFEYISGIVVSVMVLFIGFEVAKGAVQKIIEPISIKFSPITIILLLATVMVKIWYSWYCKKNSIHIGSDALKATAIDSRNDVITTMAVLVAIVVEFLTSWKVDGYISLLVSVFIVYSGAKMIKETIDPLLGNAGSEETRASIESIINKEEKILGHHDLMIHDYGPNQCFASVHVEIDSEENAMLCHDIIDKIERACEEDLGVHLVIHYDPIVVDDEELSGLKQDVKALLEEYDPRLRLHDFRVSKNEEMRKIIFDVSLPDRLQRQKSEIKKHVETGLEEKTGCTYVVIIRFDPCA